MAEYQVTKEDQINLQYNLIRSHSSGMGSILSRKAVQAVMIIRLHTFLQGKSGVSLSLIDALANYIDKGIITQATENSGEPISDWTPANEYVWSNHYCGYIPVNPPD